MDLKLALGALVCILVILVITGEGDLQAQQDHVKNYCEMVAMYDRTGGGNGWPPYKGREICE